MTNKEAKEKLYMEWQKFLEDNIDYAGVSEAYKMAFKALEQEPCEDVISRKSIKQKLQEHHDFFVNAYGGFSNLPQNDKSRVDEITNCIAMVVNEPSVTPQEPKTGHCRDCKWWKDNDGAYRRGIRAESQCPINRREVYEGNGYCFLYAPQESEE